jgi:ABC-type glutathione transport system ATPase component
MCLSYAVPERLSLNQRLIERDEVSLEVKDLKVTFHTYAGIVNALDGVDIKLYSHEVLGLVGESGCGNQ